MKTVATLFLACLAAGIARASDPVAIYSVIDRVVMEPNAQNPERVQIWGVFTLAKPDNGNDYQALQRGYLYFRLPASGNLARMEWNDLKTVAGTGIPVGFGSRWTMKARVRGPNDKPENPDPYEFGTGVVKIRSDTEYAPIKWLVDSTRH